MSIGKMARGYPPPPHILRRFAEKMDGDPNALVEAGQKRHGPDDPLARIGTSLTEEEAGRLGLSKTKEPTAPYVSLRWAVEVPETLVDTLAPQAHAGRNNMNKQKGPRDWTRCIRLGVSGLGGYAEGDLILVSEGPSVYSGLLGIGLPGGGEFRVGYFVEFLGATFEVVESQLTHTGNDFVYLGVIKGCVRQWHLSPFLAGEI